MVNFVLNNLLNMYGAMSPLGAEGALASIGVVQRVAMFAVLPLIGRVHRHPTAAGLQLRRAPVRTREEDAMVRHLRGDGHRFGAVALVHLFPEQIVGFFGITNESLRDFTVFALKVQLLMLPFIGFQIVGSNYFQATGSRSSPSSCR